MKWFAASFVLIASLSVKAFTVGAYNIRNFDYDERSRVSTDKPALVKMLTSLNADVLSVEEIGNVEEFEKLISTRMPGYKVALTECGGAHGQKLGFLYNTSKIEMLGFQEDLSISNPGNPGLCNDGSRPMAIGIFQIKASKQKFLGVTLHLKSGSRPNDVQKRAEQYAVLQKAITSLIATSGIKDFYIAGDLNTTDYLSRGMDYKLLTKLVQNLGAVDLTQNLKCSSYWWGGTDDGIETPSLLDHVIVTPGLVKTRSVTAQAHGHCKKVSCREASLNELGISYESISDHCPVTATIQ